MYTKEINTDKEVLEFVRNSKLINGCVLHLDGDEYYLKKCLEIFTKLNIFINVARKVHKFSIGVDNLFMLFLVKGLKK